MKVLVNCSTILNNDVNKMVSAPLVNALNQGQSILILVESIAKIFAKMD